MLLKEYVYNSNGDYITDQLNYVTTTSSSGSKERLRYTYDNNGNITGIYFKRNYNDETTVATYQYDALGQLIKENNKNYTYDNHGNLTKKWITNLSYEDSDWKDKLTKYGSQAITYDESGNPLSYLGATLTWKNGRQLSSYTKGNLSVTYKYNADGLRTEKNVVKNGVETNYKYTWSGNKLVHQVCGNENLYFYYDSNDEITGFSRDDGTKVTYYSYVKNIQGDIIEIIDENGNSIATYSYDAWGALSGVSGEFNISPIRYRGYYFDSEISMYYLQSRYYNPKTARFLNADDTDYIGYTKSMLSYNMFVYCENNSVNMIDSAGTDAMFLYSNAQTYYIRHGHAAILFESYGGWYYFSDNGTGGKSKTKFDFRYIGSSYYFNYGSELSNNYYEAQWQIQHPPKKVSLNKKMALLKNRLRSLGNKKSIYYIKPLTLDTKTYCDFYYIKGNFNSLHNYITTKLMKTQHNTIFNNCLKYACYSLLHGYFSNSYERHAYECALWCITPIKANIGLKFFYATYKLYYSIPWYFRSNKITPYSLFY